MSDKLKNVLLISSAGAALALGGSAVAGAADDEDSAESTTTEDRGSLSDRPRSDEQLLTGDTAARVRDVALARVAGDTIERLETDADRHARYEAHMRDASGNRVTVYVDEDFDVVEVEAGR